MARARLLKPSFFANEDLPEIDPMGRLLFMGLWCLADRAGRLEDRPRRIKGELFPYENPDVDSLLDALARHGFIERYEAGGNRYIQIATFAKHQSPHVREPESTIPAPGEHSASTGQGAGGQGAGPSEAVAVADPDPDPDPVAEAVAVSAAPPPANDFEVDLAVGRLCRTWEQQTGTTVSPAAGDLFADYLGRLPEEAIAKAIVETGANNAKGYRYTERILQRYERDGWRDEPEEKWGGAWDNNAWTLAKLDHMREHGCNPGCAFEVVGTLEQFKQRRQAVAS